MPPKNVELRKIINRRHYNKNKVEVIARNRLAKQIARAKWLEYKSTLSCSVCGESDPVTLDFHHINPAKTDRKVNKLTTNGAYKKAMEEIKKCAVLCANCHRKEHDRQRKNPTL